MVYMNQHDIKLFTENVCILRNSSKFLRPLSLSMCILQDIKNRYFMHLNIYQSPSGVKVHESISTWFYLEMVDSWDEIFWWEPLPWDHTREISNTNSCINDINELLFYKKKKKKIVSKSIQYLFLKFTTFFWITIQQPFFNISWRMKKISLKYCVIHWPIPNNIHFIARSLNKKKFKLQSRFGFVISR